MDDKVKSILGEIFICTRHISLQITKKLQIRIELSASCVYLRSIDFYRKQSTSSPSHLLHLPMMKLPQIVYFLLILAPTATGDIGVFSFNISLTESGPEVYYFLVFHRIIVSFSSTNSFPNYEWSPRQWVSNELFTFGEYEVFLMKYLRIFSDLVTFDNLEFRFAAFHYTDDSKLRYFAREIQYFLCSSFIFTIWFFTHP